MIVKLDLTLRAKKGWFRVTQPYRFFASDPKKDSVQILLLRPDYFVVKTQKLLKHKYRIV